MIKEEETTIYNFSQNPIDKIDDPDFSQGFHEKTIKMFRKMSSNFYETLAFGILEDRILRYDANEYMNFIDKFKAEIKTFLTFSHKFLKKLEEKDIKEIFDKTSTFLENINDMLLNESVDREQTMQIAIQTLEDQKNQTLKGIGMYFKVCMINYAQQNSHYLTFQTDPIHTFLKNDYLENEQTLDEISGITNQLSNRLRIHLCMVFPQGGSCTTHSPYSNVTINIMYMGKTYYLLYKDPNKQEKQEAIPLPAPDLTDLMISNYDHDKETRYPSMVDERPYRNANVGMNSIAGGGATGDFDMENGCCICHYKINERCFINSACQHKFCYNCLVEKTQQKHCSSICFEARCIKSLDLKEMEDYLVEMNMLREMELNEDALEKIPFACSKCDHQELISVSLYMMPENFVCSNCKDFQCLQHSGSNSFCMCFCEKCKEKLEDLTVISQKNCKICQKEYCSNCFLEKKTCKCFCEVCLAKKTGENGECLNCLKECMICHIKYEENSLIEANCKQHKVCRNCFIKDVKEQLILSRNSLICKFCKIINNNNLEEEIHPS